MYGLLWGDICELVMVKMYGLLRGYICGFRHIFVGFLGNISPCTMSVLVDELWRSFKCLVNPWMIMIGLWASEGYVWERLMIFLKFSLMPHSHRVVTGHDSANHHWSLVVAHHRVWSLMSDAQSPSATEMKKYFHFRNQMNGRPVVGNSWDAVETQSCWSRTTNIKKNITAAWRNIVNVLQLCLNYLPTVGRQMETVAAKWWVLETMGQNITITLPQYLN